MKKATALLLALMLVLSVGAAAFAADQSGETLVRASIESTYILTIPREQTIAFNALSTELSSPLKVTGNIASGKKVTVTAATEALACPTQDTTIPFSLQKDGSDFTSEDWTDAELRAASPKEITLSIEIAAAAWNAAKAGEYTGTITFQAKLN